MQSPSPEDDVVLRLKHEICIKHDWGAPGIEKEPFVIRGSIFDMIRCNKERHRSGKEAEKEMSPLCLNIKAIGKRIKAIVLIAYSEPNRMVLARLRVGRVMGGMGSNWARLVMRFRLTGESSAPAFSLSTMI